MKVKKKKKKTTSAQCVLTEPQRFRKRNQESCPSLRSQRSASLNIRCNNVATWNRDRINETCNIWFSRWFVKSGRYKLSVIASSQSTKKKPSFYFEHDRWSIVKAESSKKSTQKISVKSYDSNHGFQLHQIKFSFMDKRWTCEPWCNQKAVKIQAERANTVESLWMALLGFFQIDRRWWPGLVKVFYIKSYIK